MTDPSPHARRRRRQVWLAAVAVALALVAGTIGGCARVERDLSARARAGLEQVGLDDVAVDVDFRDVTLSGPVAYRDAALALVRELDGVRSGGLRYHVAGESPSPPDDPTVLTTAPAVPTVPGMSTVRPPTTVPTTPVPTTVPTTVPATTVPPTTAIDDPFAGLVLNYADGEVAVPDDGVSLVARAARVATEVLGAGEDTRVRVVGHADDAGDEAENDRLSRERAEAVRDALVARGVDPERIDVAWQGNREPIASSGTAEGRYINRRVEFLITEGAP
jgi:hypothetical protein